MEGIEEPSVYVLQAKVDSMVFQIQKLIGDIEECKKEIKEIKEITADNPEDLVNEYGELSKNPRTWASRIIQSTKDIKTLENLVLTQSEAIKKTSESKELIMNILERLEKKIDENEKCIDDMAATQMDNLNHIIINTTFIKEINNCIKKFTVLFKPYTHMYEDYEPL